MEREIHLFVLPCECEEVMNEPMNDRPYLPFSTHLIS